MWLFLSLSPRWVNERCFFSRSVVGLFHIQWSENEYDPKELRIFKIIVWRGSFIQIHKRMLFQIFVWMISGDAMISGVIRRKKNVFLESIQRTKHFPNQLNLMAVWWQFDFYKWYLGICHECQHTILIDWLFFFCCSKFSSYVKFIVEPHDPLSWTLVKHAPKHTYISHLNSMGTSVSNTFNYTQNVQLHLNLFG